MAMYLAGHSVAPKAASKAVSWAARMVFRLAGSKVASRAGRSVESKVVHLAASMGETKAVKKVVNLVV